MHDTPQLQSHAPPQAAAAFSTHRAPMRAPANPVRRAGMLGTLGALIAGSSSQARASTERIVLRNGWFLDAWRRVSLMFA